MICHTNKQIEKQRMQLHNEFEILDTPKNISCFWNVFPEHVR